MRDKFAMMLACFLRWRSNFLEAAKPKPRRASIVHYREDHESFTGILNAPSNS